MAVSPGPLRWLRPKDTAADSVPTTIPSRLILRMQTLSIWAAMLLALALLS